MIDSIDNTLLFSFQDVHPKAQLEITFKRTLRIPDNEKAFPLPPQLGNFPVKHVDDYKDNIPTKWLEHGGVMLPMHQSEALLIYFKSSYLEPNSHEYPFAVKIATGKINAISGKQWEQGLVAKPQNYLVIPEQPWLDGFMTENGVVRQFVALHLGEAITAEKQITGESTYGGLQIEVYPMKREVFDKRYPITKKAYDDLKTASFTLDKGLDMKSGPEVSTDKRIHRDPHIDVSFTLSENIAMGVAPGGRMKQKIYGDPYSLTDWDLTQTSRCFVHIANSAHWEKITGQFPPVKPPSTMDYIKAGLPWFEYYSDDRNTKDLMGSKVLAALKSIGTLFKKEKGAMSSGTSREDLKTIKIGKRKVREYKEGRKQ